MRTKTWVEHTAEVLRDAGYRSGEARAAVIEVLGEQECCVDAQAIFDRVRERGRRRVGIASVYRTLDLLSELGLVQRLDVGGGGAHFEPVRPDGEHHHHVVCDDCGRVSAFADPGLEQALDALARRLDFRVGAHEVVLRGACGDCAG